MKNFIKDIWFNIQFKAWYLWYSFINVLTKPVRIKTIKIKNCESAKEPMEFTQMETKNV